MDLGEQTGYQMEPPLFQPLRVQSLSASYSIFHIQEESVFLSWLDSRASVQWRPSARWESTELKLANTHKAWILLLSRVELLKCSWACVFGGQHSI